MANVLIASLGDSPVVVTAMFDLLQKENKGIDHLEVFYPNNDFAIVGYEDLICKLLPQKCEKENIQCEIDGILLDHNDVGAEDAAYDFLHKLYQRLDEHQKNGNIVYLSLAGGRKSMAALMALLAPLFPCVKALYHILDQDEGKKGHFLSTQKLYDLSVADQQRCLFPSSERILLLPIPYGREQQLSAEDKSRLFALTEEQLGEMWERDPEQAAAIKTHTDGIPGEILRVELTKEVAEQYRQFLRSGGIHGKRFGICFYQMHFEDYRIRNAHQAPYKYKGRTFHYYKRPHTDERPVFHIETTEGNIKKVVVSALPIEIQGKTPSYPPLKELVDHLEFPLKTEVFETEEAREHILIIPLATSPMVATQLYQLYIDKGYKVHSVILVHTQHRDVRASVQIVREAFASAGITCEAVPLEGWDDIDTADACTAYQALLEQTIQRMRDQYPSYLIELTISGGRKGMAAMATFAAQQQDIRRIVHTVIHERISDKVNEETTVEELKKLARTSSKKLRDDRLFLRAYQDEKDAFVLFNIPVIPCRKDSNNVTGCG